jgi:hypothetical protein
MASHNGRNNNPDLQNMGDAVRAMLTAQPFSQFEIRLADGDTIRIHHPDYAIVSPNRRQVLTYDKDGHLRIINMRLATSVEPVRAQEKRRGKR